MACSALRLEAAPASLDVQLLRAVSTGNMKTVQSLIKKGAKVNARNTDGTTPLILAARQNSLPLVDFLLKHGADARARDKAGVSCLGYQPALAESLWKRGARATPSDAAILSDYLEELIDSDRKDKDVEAKARMLVRVGMNLNTIGPGDTGVTPLISAIDSRPSLVPLLLSLGADPNLIDFHGRTPLIATIEPTTASDEDEEPASLTLLKHGAKLDAGDSFDTTALMMALLGGRFTLARELISRGAKVNSKDKWGQTALMCAAARGSGEMVRLLLDSGADPKLKNFQGKTALVYAQSQGEYSELVGLTLSFSSAKEYQRQVTEGQQLKGRKEIQAMLQEKPKSK
ncbi:hypothetical protein IAD21_04085 [Abditibacteriota bacterium]|nr:hypothetical protein IAD21_04085 [Abditibacteriota bacterium]